MVLLTSGQHLAPMTREVAYAVSKGALQQATLTLADELANRQITVVLSRVNPGPTDTGWGLAEQGPPSERCRSAVGENPMTQRDLAVLALQR